MPPEIEQVDSFTLERLIAEYNARLEAEDDLIRREFGFKVEKTSINEEERTATFIFSTDSIDSYNEIVRQDWDKNGRLNRYRNNPTVLYAHNRAGGFFGGSAKETLPIGFCTDCKVVKGQLQGTIKFVTKEANEMAELVWQGVLQGSLRAVSVGFKSHTIKYETENDVERLVLSDNELFEVSVCPMGANRDAVRLSPGRQKQRQRLEELARKDTIMATDKDDKKETVDVTATLAKLASMEAENAKLKAEKDAADLKAKAAEDAAKEAATKTRATEVSHEAQSLVNDKISPAQIQLFIELRCAPEEFSTKFLEFVKLNSSIKSLTEPVIDNPVGEISSKTSKLAELAQKIYDESMNKSDS